MPRLALAIAALWFISLFVFRTVVQLRHTGSTGVKGFHGRIGSLPWIAGVSASLGLFLAPIGPASAVFNWPGAELLVTREGLHLVGALFALCGIAGALTAQLKMGDSWRVGVDESESTALVTTGLFAWVRNPIFAFIGLSLLGLIFLVPNFYSLAAAALTLLGIELQVRAVEEPYLARTHGDAYKAYSSRVGRFLPGLGLRGQKSNTAHLSQTFLVFASLGALTASQPGAAQTVHGQVTEVGTGASLPLVSVIAETTGASAETDERGHFEITTEENGTLRFEYPGWKTQAVPASARSVLTIELEPNDAPMRPNFDNTESIIIEASPAAIWNYVTDYEKNWVASNHEHISVRFLSRDKTFRNGIRFVLSEHVGNGRADMTGYLTDVVPNETYTWVARAVYTGYGGFSVRVNQTGTFSIQTTDDGVLVSHRIRASFPESFWGQLARFVAENIGDAAGDAAIHTRIELEYFKEQIEAQEPARSV